MKIVQARHEGNNKNYYFVTTIEGMKKGDNLIVDTKFGIQKAIFYSYVDFESLGAKVGVPRRSVISKVDELNKSYWDTIQIVDPFEEEKECTSKEQFEFDAIMAMHKHDDNERIRKEMRSDAKTNTGMRRFLKVIKKFQVESEKTDNVKYDEPFGTNHIYTINSPLLDGKITIEGGINYLLFRKLMIEEFGSYDVLGGSEYYNLKIEGYDNLSVRLERKVVRY